MCLILLAWQAHPDYPLIVAANRDEFHARPTQAAHIWPDTDPAVMAGKDLQAGGTWMGITANRRFAAVTNYREVPATESELSRGQLITDYLLGNEPARAYAEQIHAEGQRYAGFNLLIGDRQTLLHVSNRSDGVTPIEPGIHGLSNAVLNTPWPKVSTGKAQLAQAVAGQPDHAGLQAILADERTADDQDLPATGVAPELERVLSARKIITPNYGTRSATSLLVDSNGRIDFFEQSFDATGNSTGQRLLRM